MLAQNSISITINRFKHVYLQIFEINEINSDFNEITEINGFLSDFEIFYRISDPSNHLYNRLAQAVCSPCIYIASYVAINCC